MVDRVDTVVNVDESEKCALDMSSYEDLHSSIATSVGSDGDGREDYVFVDNNDVSLDDHTKNSENVARLSVNGDVETDRLEDEVMGDETGLKIEEGVNEGEENGEIRSGSNILEVESGGNVDVSGRVLVVKEGSDRETNVDDRELNLDEVREGSGRASTLDEVKEGSDRETKLDEVREGNDREPTLDEVREGSGRESTLDEVREGSNRESTLDEVKEGSDREPTIDEVREGSGREPTLDEVREGSGREPTLDKVREGSDREATLDVVREGSDRESTLDEVKEDSDRETKLDGVTDGSDRETKLDEVKDGSFSERGVDGVKESSNPKPVVDQVKEAELGFEASDSGNVYGIGSQSSDVDGNNKGSVSEVQESAFIETEDVTALSSIPDAAESSEIKEVELGFENNDNGDASVDGVGSHSSDVEDNNKDSISDVLESAAVEAEDISAVNSVSDLPELSEVKGVELGFESNINGIGSLSSDVPDVPEPSDIKELLSFENNDNGNVSGDEIGPRSSDVDNNSKDSNAQESAKVATDDTSAVNSVPDVSDPSEAEVQIETATLEVPESKLEIKQQIHEEEVELTENNVDHGIKSPFSELESGDSQAMETETRETGASEKSVRNDLTEAQPQKPELEPLDMQFDTKHKSAIATEPERVDGDVKSEMMVETGPSQEVSPEERVLQDQIIEQPVSLDVVNRDFSLEEGSTEKTLLVDDTTNMLKLKSTDGTPTDADWNDLDGSHAREDVSENEAVTASDEPSSRDPNILDERGVVDDVSSVADNSTNGLADDTCSQTGTANSEIAAAVKSNNVSDRTLRPNISFGSFGTTPLSHTDINLQSDGLNKSTAVGMISSKTKLYSANGVTSLNAHPNGDHFAGLDHDTTACVEVTRPEQTNGILVAPVEGTHAQNNNPDFARVPFYWLIKIPRVDEGKYRELLKASETELAEKTKTRNAFQAEFTKHQVYCRELRSTLEAAKTEARAALDFMRVKRREIDSGQYIINLARRAVTVEDVDNQRLNLEHMLQHETHTLRAERDLVREIRQLNHQRQQLSADPQRQQEVQQALNQRDQTGEQLKVLKKELDALKENFSKADEQVRAAQKKHDDEIDLLNNLKHQVITANDIRQEAYARAMTLKKQLYEKSAPFYQAKNDLRIAYNFARAGNRDSLERHCINQVETIMEMWNKNGEFRKEYIECNKRRMLWKFGTLDGTQLGINEMPPFMGEVSDNRVHTSAKINSPMAVLPVQKELPVVAKIIEAKITEDKITVKNNKDISKNSLAIVSTSIEIEEDKEEPKPTTEEQELARKAEELRREEEAARLREQRKLEEKAKAEEALERKRRYALKAQARAEFKARKEAEEKERRALKKQNKGINVNTAEIETGEPSVPSSESANEPEVAEKPAAVGKRLKQASLHTKQIKTAKPIPAALRNKGRRGLLRYWPYACIVLLAIGLFHLGSLERIQAIKELISGLLRR